MSETNLEVKKEEVVVEKPVEYTDLEKKALDMGWRPEEEFDGDKSEFIPAGEFVRRKPLFDKINEQGKLLKQTIKALEAFKQHHSEMREVEFNRALKELKNERKQALTDSDGDKFDTLDEQIREIEKQVEQVQVEKITPVVQEEPPIHPELQTWMSRNSWYQQVGYMRNFADTLGQQLAGTMAPGEVLKVIEKKVREEFPTKFRNSAKDSAPDVGRSSGSSQKKADNFELTDMEKRVMNALTSGKNPTMTKEAYLSDLRKKKGVA